MKQCLLCTLALVALVAIARADDEKKKEASPAPASVKSLTAEWSKVRGGFVVAFGQAKTEEDRQKVLDEMYALSSKFSRKFLDFAKANADDPTAFDALKLVISMDSQGDVAKQAIPLIVANHLDDPKIVRLCRQLAQSSSPSSRQFLRAVADSSDDVNARGWATYSLAKSLMGRTGEKNEKAETLLTRVIKDYAKVDNGSLGTMAERDLFELQHLSIGSHPPEIKGEDIDGVEFSLADYRGKVVLLDFWGDW